MPKPLHEALQSIGEGKNPFLPQRPESGPLDLEREAVDVVKHVAQGMQALKPETPALPPSPPDAIPLPTPPGLKTA